MDESLATTATIGEYSVASNSLQLSLSGADSSGYESFAPFKSSSESTPVNDDFDERTEPTISQQSISERVQPQKRPASNVKKVHLNWKQRRQIDAQVDAGNNNRPPSVGIFLDILLKKLEYMTENSVYVNLHLTGLISRLAIYPQPLLQSFLLNHSLVFQPSIKSLFQVSLLLISFSFTHIRTLGKN